MTFPESRQSFVSLAHERMHNAPYDSNRITTLGRPRGATDRCDGRHALQRVRHEHLQPDRDSSPGVLEAFTHIWGLRDHCLERENDRRPRHRNGGLEGMAQFAFHFQ